MAELSSQSVEDTAGIHIHHRVPVLVGQRRGRSQEHHTGDVGSPVKRSELCDCCLDPLVHLLPITDVDHSPNVTFSFKGVECFVESLSIDVADGYQGTPVGEELRRSQPDAGSGSADSYLWPVQSC